MRRCARNSSSGFTLVELMLVVAIMGILFGIALPAFSDWVRGAKVRSVTSDLYASVIKARSEAIKRNRDIVLAPNPTWADGWTVKQSGVATVLDQRQAVADVTITIRQRSGSTWSTNAGSITFKNTGRLDVAAEQVAFVVTASGSGARCVDLAPSGRPSVRVDTDGSATDACE